MYPKYAEKVPAVAVVAEVQHIAAPAAEATAVAAESFKLDFT